MDRRLFLRNVSLSVGGQIMLNGIAMQALRGQPQLSQMAQLSGNDKILVLLQLHGGNDGLNAVIPIPQYNLYYNMRPNLAIPDSGGRKYIRLDSTLAEEQQVGLHPDMTGMKELYDQGRMNIVQNVGYEHVNGSHFKSRDIWFGGGGYKDDITGGWIGRYLESEYATRKGLSFPTDFPNAEMPDPLGLEFANEVSLGFHTESTVPAGLSIPSPADFFDLVKELPGYNEEIKVDPRGFPPEAIKNSLYGQELQWILGIEKDTDKYAERLQKTYLAGGATSVQYPTVYPLAAPTGDLKNPIAANLKIVARLVAGGCQTKVYMIRIGGFDTHVNQVTPYDNTLGKHAALMYHISSAMKAFQDDLKARGIEDRVLTVTLSEFGRRAVSNNNYGSDHGTVAPMFVFGSKINPGLIGKNADLRRVNEFGGNLPDGKEDVIDYRIVFNTILQDWFAVDSSRIPEIFPSLETTASQSYADPDIFDKVPLFGQVTAIDEFVNRRFRLNNCFPNPVKSETNFSFFMDNPATVRLSLYDMRGSLVETLLNEPRMAGEHIVPINLSHLRAGIYIYKIDAGMLKGSKKLVKS